MQILFFLFPETQSGTHKPSLHTDKLICYMMKYKYLSGSLAPFVRKVSVYFDYGSSAVFNCWNR